ncbi:CapA family protein [Acidaminobacter sp. JC074]|uniref:CapA family protein n=1 Tax=Acidaminobacter sp. JC074 TaxID=2530199 RepID=UPI001F0E1E74|nr:CapA family protein [Acidaminobacter sp. JC074]MCH4889438.1 CapA family protein [Acidaminobacter sp. JC074]
MRKILVIVIAFALIGLTFFVTAEREDYREARLLERPFVGPTVYDFKSETYHAFDDTMKKEYEYKVSVLSVGDIMAHTIQFEAARTDDGYDFYPQFSEIAEVISERDFAIANLETVFAGEDRRYSGKNMIFNAPDQLGESIKKAGFDIVTTANNHSLDRGFQGIQRTIETLDQIGLLHTGTYASDERDILTFEKDGISFALLSYSYSTNGWPIPSEKPDSINMMEKDLIISDIKRAKALGVDFIMVANHWGLEYHLNENHHQRDLAQALFYAGADIILGTHPHVLQPFDHKRMIDESGLEKDKFIIYSQGNFVSGQRTYPKQIGMYIDFEFTRKGSNKPYVSQIAVMPTFVEANYKNSQRFMRVLDTNKACREFESGDLDISQALYNELLIHEKTFVDHLASKVNFKPYLNDKKAYVLYDY